MPTPIPAPIPETPTARPAPINARKPPPDDISTIFMEYVWLVPLALTFTEYFPALSNIWVITEEFVVAVVPSPKFHIYSVVLILHSKVTASPMAASPLSPSFITIVCSERALPAIRIRKTAAIRPMTYAFIFPPHLLRLSFFSRRTGGTPCRLPHKSIRKTRHTAASGNGRTNPSPEDLC